MENKDELEANLKHKEWLVVLETEIIPRLETMLAKEVEHYKSLRSHKVRWWQIDLKNTLKTFQENSMKRIEETQNIIKAYSDYLRKEKEKLEQK